MTIAFASNPNKRTALSQALYQFIPPATSDPYFDYTTLLLPGNGSNGANNNTFLDGSTNNFTITRNGNTTQGTFSPFSQTGWGNYFSGGANYLNVAAASSIDLASSDFTIECWAYPGTQTNAVDAVFGYGGFTTMLYRNGTTWSWEVGNGSSANYFTITATVTPNAWQHIALTRSGNTFTFWINGALANTNSTANAVGTASKNLTIGYNNNPPNAQYFTGYISNFRIVKGTAVYTSAFTPPTAPLTAISNTSLLTCQSNRFIDTNTQLTAKTITLTGSPSVVPFSPFNPTSAWSASTVGGSGYFDGTGDQLTIANNSAFDFGTGDFTIEAWCYFTGTSGSIINYSNGQTSNSNFAWEIYQNSATSIQTSIVQGSTGYIASSTALVANAWNHVAGVRNGNTLTIYVNGVAGGTTANVTGVTANNPGSATVKISGYNNAAGCITGYVSNARIVKGTAVYTGNFTPPTAPITNAGSTSAASYPSTTNVNTSFASSDTSLLLNFTNAGIYDATAKNVLETVGNAQASTTQSKWSPTSMYFDGTGDYLTTNPGAAIANPGTIWTVEGWFYPTTVLNTAGMVNINTGAANAGVNIYRNGTTITVDNGVTAGTGPSGGTLVANTWQHVAVASNGTSTKIFLNGTQVGSTYTGTVTSGTPSQIWVGTAFTGLNAWTGYMQDVRITKGYARYTANFTPPTAAFPIQ